MEVTQEVNTGGTKARGGNNSETGWGVNTGGKGAKAKGQWGAEGTLIGCKVGLAGALCLHGTGIGAEGDEEEGEEGAEGDCGGGERAVVVAVSGGATTASSGASDLQLTGEGPAGNRRGASGGPTGCQGP